MEISGTFNHPDNLISLRISGTEKPLILVHGFCLSGNTFDPVVRLLESEYKVVVPDLPGHGESGYANSVNSLENAAQYLVDMHQELNLTQCTWVGHSMGGYIALAIAAKHPKLVDQVILLHSTPAIDSAERQLQRTKVAEHVRQHGPNAFYKTFVSDLFGGNDPDASYQMLELVRKTNPEALIDYTIAMRDRKDYRAILRELEIPVNAIAGDLDPYFSVEDLEQALAGVGRVHVLPKVAHMGMTENPEGAAEAIRKFEKRS